MREYGVRKSEMPFSAQHMKRHMYRHWYYRYVLELVVHTWASVFFQGWIFSPLPGGGVQF